MCKLMGFICKNHDIILMNFLFHWMLVNILFLYYFYNVVQGIVMEMAHKQIELFFLNYMLVEWSYDMIAASWI